jgi:malonyl-CoA/methylmalonyl-CoA synthetase
MRPWTDHLPEGSVVDASGLTAAGTLPRAWARRWGDDPAAPLWREAGTGGWRTAEEFDAATRLVAGRLRGAGLLPGDRVVWSTSSSIAALAAHVGALRAGLVVVPSNTAYSERELAHIVADVRPSAAIVERDEQATWIRSASTGRMVIVGPEVDLPDTDPGPIDQAAPDDPALICFTSGTTGSPKGAVLAHRNILAATESVTAAWRWAPDDRLVHCLPVFHAHGLGVGVYGTLLAGASAVLLPGFDPGAVARAAGDDRATLFFGVPTMYHRLIGSGQASALRGLRVCVSGSAPLSPDLHGQVSAAVGSQVLERYGMTETLMNVSNPYDGERRAGTVGFPLPGVDLRFAADGEILVRGPNVFGGYWERPGSNLEAFVSEGEGGQAWFRTGDLGEDVDGYLVIRGRSKELIISGGFNVYPSEVEDVLARHPAVAEVAVTGTPSEEWGEVVTAWIVPDGPAPSVGDLAEFTISSLAPYKRPRVVRVVDALPRNALGKVLRGELREGGLPDRPPRARAV